MAASLLIAAGCGADPSSGPGEGTPAAATTAFLRAVDDGDCEAVRDRVLTPSELDCSVVEAYADLLGGAAPDDVDVREVSVEGPSAVVEVGADPGDELELQRVDGAWLVVIDSAA